MKPVHAGLLIVGAALAGGLAIEMTEPEPIPVAPIPASIEVRQVAPQVSPAPAPVPAPVEPVPAKPSPWPNRVASDKLAAAPAPVYEEPARVQIPKTPIRKDKPILTAKSNPPIANPMPPFLPPVPYAPPAASVVPPQPEPKAEPAFSPRQVTIPAGMTVQIRLNESLTSDRGAPGDTFDASLAEPLIIDGLAIAERGARAGGRIVDVQKAGGTSSVALELTNLVTADGQKIAISTDPWTRRGDLPSHVLRAEDAAKIGGGAALGAMIGAVAGGGKGAAIGAGVGGAAGVGTVLATRGKPVNIPAETIIRFRLATRVTIRERQL